MVFIYNFKFNAFHDTSLQKNNPHPHTFNVFCKIESELEAGQIEPLLAKYFDCFKGANLNLFTNKVPTLENIGEMIFDDLNKINGINLLLIEIGDKPIQSIIIRQAV